MRGSRAAASKGTKFCRTQGDFCSSLTLSVRLSAHQSPKALSGLKSALSGLESALLGLGSALSGLKSTLSGLKSTPWADLRTERTGFRPEKADFRPDFFHWFLLKVQFGEAFYLDFLCDGA